MILSAPGHHFEDTFRRFAEQRSGERVVSTSDPIQHSDSGALLVSPGEESSPRFQKSDLGEAIKVAWRAIATIDRTIAELVRCQHSLDPDVIRLRGKSHAELERMDDAARHIQTAWKGVVKDTSE